MPDYTASKPVNILRGIVPTASGWDTAPTDLANCTDGNFSTVTGTGVTTLVAGGAVGIVGIDTGRISVYLIHYFMGVWRTAGSVYFYVEASNDGVNWVLQSLRSDDVTNATEALRNVNRVVYGRYIRIRITNTDASTTNARFYQILGWELGT